MQGNRHQKRLTIRSDQRRHVARHRSRKRDFPPVFQAQRNASRKLVIGERRPCAPDARRLGDAKAARVCVRGLQRDSAGRAAALAEELDPGPAFRTEAMQGGDDGAAARATGWQGEIQHLLQCEPYILTRPHSVLVAAHPPPHKRPVADELFEQKLRALRRKRALRRGLELFLHERAFEDIIERLSLVQRRFRSGLLVGPPNPGWRERLLQIADQVDLFETDGLMQLEPGSYDLCVAVGELDTVNDLPRALLTIRFALREDSLFIGAVPGGDTLPALRSAMRAADEKMGAATPHVHPRIEPAGFTSLLSSAGFTMPVVDVDRVQVSYKGLADLVRDLRSMGATNILASRARRPLTREAIAAASRQFLSGAEDGRVTEMFELLHFAAWTSAAPVNG